MHQNKSYAETGQKDFLPISRPRRHELLNRIHELRTRRSAAGMPPVVVDSEEKTLRPYSVFEYCPAWQRYHPARAPGCTECPPDNILLGLRKRPDKFAVHDVVKTVRSALV